MSEFEQSSVSDLNMWIEKLYDCKQLTEIEIKKLTQKVRSFVFPT